jgi:hypothetical protein
MGRQFISQGKDNFCFNHPNNPDADSKTQGAGSSIFLSRGILKKELRFTGCTSHQVDQHGHLPEVNVEISEQMLDQIINSSARSVVTEKIGFNQQLTEDLI